MSPNVQSVGPANAGHLLRVGTSTLLLVLALAGPSLGQDRDHRRGSGSGQNANPAVDPGLRGGSPGSGQPIANLSGDQMRFFTNAQQRFNSPEAVVNGLGPTFNGNSCGMCHSQPATGGTSPAVNPQVALAKLNNASNVVPSFITMNGPVREVRFKFLRNPDGSLNLNQPDNGVHDVFVITGRTDAPAACTMAQEDFPTAIAQHNLSFRIPTPVFGDGLIEMIDEATILSNTQPSFQKSILGIAGRPNRNGNDGTIARFGWKAQNKSLLMFASEAYNVELGETNQMFPNERGFPPNPPPANCLGNPQPEDFTNLLSLGSDTAAVPSDDDSFATFMRFLDQPTPACIGTGCSPSIQNGNKLFTSIGCALCHTPSMMTGQSNFTVNPPGLSGVQANLFSDLVLHHMGDRLQDGISQGNAGPDEFRTAPLWGLGQRLFFLHDGRTSDLLQVIHEHRSNGSEANGVIENFHALKPAEQQDLVNFLRSL